jgi:hypothetical protein
MTVRANLHLAAALSALEDNLTQAIVNLGLPNPVITVEISADGAAGVRMILPVNPANLTTLLNARLTQVQANLTALGVT